MARFIIAEQSGGREGAGRVSRGNFGQKVEQVVQPSFATANSFGAIEAEAQFQRADAIARNGAVLGGAIEGAGNVVKEFANRQNRLNEFDERQEIQFQNKDVELAVKLRDAETMKKWRGNPNPGSAELLRVELANNRIEEFARFEDHGFTSSAARGLDKLRAQQLQQSIDSIPIPGGQFEKFQIEKAQGRIKDQNDKVLAMSNLDSLSLSADDALRALHVRAQELDAIHTDPANATMAGGQENAEINRDGQLAIMYDNHLQGTITKANSLPWQSGDNELVALEGWLREANKDGSFVWFPGISAKQRSNMIAKVADEREKLKGTAIIAHNSKVSDAEKSLDGGGRAPVAAILQEAQALDRNGKKGLVQKAHKLEIKEQVAGQLKEWKGQSLPKLNDALDKEIEAATNRSTDSAAQVERRNGLIKIIKDQKRAKNSGAYLQYAADAIGTNLEPMSTDRKLPNPKKRVDFCRRARSTFGEKNIMCLTAPEITLFKNEWAFNIATGDEGTLLKNLQDDLFMQLGRHMSDDESDAEILKITEEITRQEDFKTAYVVKSIHEQSAEATAVANKYMEFKRNEATK